MSSSSVSRMSSTPELIKPSGPTPSGILPLSFMDRVPMLRHLGDELVVFGEGKEPGKVIREALGRALVLYYPMAGRLLTGVVGEDGSELSVECNGEGVWFVEATYGCTLEEVNYVKELPFVIPIQDLLPPLPADVHPNDIIFMLQVTQFKCGGFTLGIRFNHAMVDGAGLGQFVQAIGEIARGLNEPTIKPIWYRDAINNATPIVPKWPQPPPIDFTAPQIKLRRHSFDISLDRIDELKLNFKAETGGNITCTAFDILVAKLWQSRTRAIHPKKTKKTVSLHFSANARQALHDLLPPGGGYYGNCIHPLLIEASSELIRNAPFFDIVKLIRAAKESVPSKFRRWMEGVEALPPMSALGYDTLCLMDWRWLGLYGVDFGWGTAKYVVPMMEHGLSFGTGCLLNQPPPMKGIRLLTECVAEEHFEDFCNEMMVLC